MKLFNGILGVFAAFAAVFCFCFPGRTFLNAGWMITFLLLGWGICALFDFFTSKAEGKSNLVKAIIAVVAGIVVAVASVVAICCPVFVAVTDYVIIYTFLFWLLFSGVTKICNAFMIKKLVQGKKWIFVLISGILTLLLGIYGLSHILFTVWTISIMFGIVIMGYAVGLISSVFE